MTNTTTNLPALVDHNGEPLQRAGVGGPYSITDEEVLGFFSGLETEAGVRLTHQKALAYAPWWRGINLISRHVAKLPLLVYRRDGEDRQRDHRHPAYRILRRKANDQMVAFHAKLVMTAQALDCGNGYGYIERARDDRPLGIWPLDPRQTYPVRVNGELWYITTFKSDGNVVQRKLRPKDVFHLKGLGFDGLCGYDVFSLARQSIGLGLAAEKHGQRFFKNAAVPNVVLETAGQMKEPQAKELIKNFNNMVQGLENHYKTALLTGGVSAKVLTLDARRAQLIQTREFELKAAANFLGLPPHKLGDDTRNSYNSLEQENQAFIDDGLDFWFCNWEEEANDKLLSKKQQERDTHYVEFVREGLLRADLSTRGAYYQTATGGRPWMTPDEVRRKENMPSKGGEADELKDPLNMGGEGGDDEPPEDPPADDPPEGDEQGNSARAAVRAVLLDATRRACKRFAVKAAKQSRGNLPAIRDLAADPGVAAILEPAVQAAASVFAINFTADEVIDCIRSMAGLEATRATGFDEWEQQFVSSSPGAIVEIYLG